MSAIARRFQSFAEIFQAHADGQLSDISLERLLNYLDDGIDDEGSDQIRGSSSEKDQVRADPSPETEIIQDSETDEGVPLSRDDTRIDLAKQQREDIPQSFEMEVSADLDPSFPDARRGGKFAPSPFQAALLDHVAQVRAQLGHANGLLVMATALGKTVFVILDMERQLLAGSGKEEGTGEGEQSAQHVRLSGERGPGAERTSHEVVEALREAGGDMEAAARALVERTGTEREAGAKVADHSDRAEAGETDGGKRGTGLSVEGARDERLALGTKRRKRGHLFLFLVHTRAIRDGAFEKFRRHFAELGFERSRFVNIGDAFGQGAIAEEALRHADFIFCLFQSFDRLPPTVRTQVTHVCYDECHHLLAATFTRIFTTLAAAPNLRYCLGMTATLRHRSDPTGEGLKKMFGGVVYIDFSWVSAKAMGFFPPVDYLECSATLRSTARTYAQLAASFREHRRVQRFIREVDADLAPSHRDATGKDGKLSGEAVATAILSFHAARREAGLAPKRRVLVFVSSTAVADELCLRLNRASKQGESALHLKALAAHYKQGARAADHVTQFASQPAPGWCHILVTVTMLNEGYDCPGVDMVVMARITESEIVFAQQLGRGLRRDKTDPAKQVAVLDLALNLRRRWRRLLGELPEGEVAAMIEHFWHVDTFIGIAPEQST